MTSRPDYHETTRATDSMNTEADQNPQIVSKRHECSDDLDPDNLKWPTWLSQYMEMIGRGPPTLKRFGFHTVVPSRIDVKTSCGKPCSFFGRMGFAFL